ncbi:MAG: glycosyltransferase family 2 protein [Candidatus Hodarchaeota archaeon]
MVSVIIPTYNHAKYVCRAIDSVLEQTYTNFEIIIVDDGSTDNTRDVLEPYMNKIKYIYQENKGLAASRNTGIRASKGQYLQFLDADDIILPKGLDIQVKILETHPDVDVVAGRYRTVDTAGRFLSNQRRFPNKIITFKDLVVTNRFAVNALLLRRKCFTSAGFFDEHLKSCEDWDMWLRIAAQNHRFLCHNHVLVQCYRYPSTMVQNVSRMCDMRLAVLNKVFAYPDLDEEIKALKKMAYSIAFFQCSQGFYSNNRMEDGRKYSIKAIKLNPLTLMDYKTFYHFDTLFKPFRYNTIPIGKEMFENITIEIFSTLDELYSKNNLPVSIIHLKNQAYSNANFGIALRYYEFRKINKFLSYFIKALRIYPQHVLKSAYIYACLNVLLGIRSAKAISRLKKKILRILKS